jgi:hypothetical protein
VILSKLTGWDLADILELDCDDFWSWHATAQTVENDIAQRLREQ